MASESFAVVPVAHVVGGRTVVEDDFWGGNRSIIRIDPELFDEGAVVGLDAFSHIEVVFRFHLTDPTDLHPEPRRRATIPTGRSGAPSPTATCVA